MQEFLEIVSKGVKRMARIKFMNTEIDNLTMKEALEKIDNLIRKQQALAIVADSTQSYISKTRFSEAEIVTKKRD